MHNQAALEKAIVEAEGTRGANFIGHLQRVKAFKEAQGRLPRSRARGDLIPPEELQAGNWVRHVRKKRDAQSSDRKDLIELMVPGLLQAEREYLDWEVRLQHVVDFRRTHGRLPRYWSVDSAPDETVLGNWRNEVKRKQHLLTPEQNALIASVCPDLLDSMRRQTWEESLGEYLAFVEANSRDPRQDIPEERRLGLWATKVRSYPEKLSETQIETLTTLAPPLLKPAHRSIDESIRKVQDFRSSTGRWPRVAGKGVDEEERRLGSWRALQRKKVHTMSPERLQLINEALPGMLER